MVKRLILLIFVVAGFHCSVANTSDESAEFFQDYEKVLHDFHREINTSITIRKRALEFFKQELLEGDAQYFNASEIADVQTTVERYVQNRQVLLHDIAYRYRKLIDGMELALVTDKPTGKAHRSGVLALGRKNYLQINPNDELGRQYIKALKMGLAAALTLYDNFKIAISPFQDNGRFRRKINNDNLDNKKVLEEISGNFRRLDNYKDTLRVVEFNEQLQKWASQNPQSLIAKDEDLSYFNVLIDGSYTNRKIQEVTLVDRVAFRTIRLRRILRDYLFEFGEDSMNLVSKGFGNGVGLVETRQGYLKSIPTAHKQKIEDALKPGDILLEKTPFRLTDRFIPGHWGHVAIWTGNQKQLEDLGIWQRLPDLYKKAKQRLGYEGPSFQSQIKAGRKVIEALRPGVEINTLEHFLNIDDMAVLRDRKVNKLAMQRYLLRAFEQVGKEYDFNFDVETDTKIVCSELAFVAYDDYQWPIEKTAGRYTISPDHVGEKAKNGNPFVPVMLYHDGLLVGKNIQLNFNRLMNAQYQDVRTDLVPIK